MKKITIILFTMLSINFCFAQTTTTFTGAVSGDWHTPGNWSNGVPDQDKRVIIPAGKTTTATRGIACGEIENAGTMFLNPAIHVNTGEFTNTGTLTCSNNIFGSLSENTYLSVNNSGNINSSNLLGFNAVGVFTNSGTITSSTLLIKAESVENQEAGKIVSGEWCEIDCGGFGNYGFMSTNGDIKISASTVAYNSGKIYSILKDVYLIVRKKYFTETGSGEIKAFNGKVIQNSKKTVCNGQISGLLLDGGFKSAHITDQDAGSININVDTAWIVGDSVKMEAETIRFVFDYLHIFAIDSIKDIYANSKIEFYGTKGSTLDFRFNETEDFIYVEDGSIEIHSDNIVSPDHDISYFCSPEPIVSPSDTTLIDSFIGSSFAVSPEGDEGMLKVYTRSNSTGHYAFDFEVSSSLGWVNETSGTTPTLAPFQFDSLMINYEIPMDGDTLIDTVMVILSIPGEYADTAYSYIRSIPLSPVSVEEFLMNDPSFEVNAFPNPFYDHINIHSSNDASVNILDVTGRNLFASRINANQTIQWIPASSIKDGMYFIRVSTGRAMSTKKILFRRR